MNFIQFAQACGVVINRLVSDGRIHRCGTVLHPRSKNGAYAFDGDRGWAMAWDAGDQVQWFSNPHAKPWTDAEKRDWMARKDAERRAQERRYQEVAKSAETLLRACTMAEHGYLRLKGFPKVRALVKDETLVVPMRNVRTNAVQGVQTIHWDVESRQWVKKMIYGMRAKAAVFRLGRASRETVLCEGFATGLSIDAALKQIGSSASVLVCFSAQNMQYVAEQIPGQVFVFADNDASGTGERVAKAIGRPYCMAPTVGHDANDWHMAEGLLPLCSALMAARREGRAAA